MSEERSAADIISSAQESESTGPSKQLRQQKSDLDGNDVERIRIDNEKPITKIQIDGIVLMKIVEHCVSKLQYGYPDVSGVLLGLNVENTLEVTSCFPMPDAPKQHDYNEKQSRKEYQEQTYNSLKIMNIDDSMIGWYKTCEFEDFRGNLQFINTQYEYQKIFKQRCICIIYDHMKSQKGKIALKAVRLSDKFMDVVKKSFVIPEKDENGQSNNKYRLKKVDYPDDLPKELKHVSFKQETLNQLKLTEKDIFEEVPLEFNNSLLSQVYLNDLTDDLDLDKSDKIQYESFDLETNGFLRVGIQKMGAIMDNLNQDQYRFQYYIRNMIKMKDAPDEEERKKIEKSSNQPNRLTYLSHVNQLHTYCDDLESYASTGISNLKLSESLLVKNPLKQED